MKIHMVKAGETLGEIAASYGVSPMKLAENNGLSYKGELIEGEELLILVPTRTTVAGRGERLSDIAERFGVRESTLMGYNPECAHGGELYEGEQIAVRYGTPTLGLGIGNGYFYRSCKKEQLIRAMPYLSYLTISCAIGKRGGLTMLFDDTEIAALGRAAGKLPLLRIRLETESAKERLESIRCAAIKAAAGGYHGLTLSGDIGEGRDGESLMLDAKKLLAEFDLSLFLECDLDAVPPAIDYADGGVISFDKIHLDPIPSFEDGERRAFTRFAEEHDALRCFIDLSPFALGGTRYLTKDEAREAVRRGGGRMMKGENGAYLYARAGRGRGQRTYVMESMENTSKKLELLSECGYYGAAFDIARTSIYDLLMFRTSFAEGIGMC